MANKHLGFGGNKYNPPQRRKKTKQTPTASAFKGLNSNQLRKILGEVTAKP
jgi:hypothetical protein